MRAAMVASVAMISVLAAACTSDSPSTVPTTPVATTSSATRVPTAAKSVRLPPTYVTTTFDGLRLRHLARWRYAPPGSPPAPGRTTIGNLTTARIITGCRRRHAPVSSAIRCIPPVGRLRRGELLVSVAEGAFAFGSGAVRTTATGARVQIIDLDPGQAPGGQTKVLLAMIGRARPARGGAMPPPTYGVAVAMNAPSRALVARVTKMIYTARVLH